MILVDEKGSKELMMAISERADGTVRQVLVQDSNRTVYGRGFFRPGTVRDPENNWLKSVCFHWIDAFTDEELLDPKNQLTLTQDDINRFREESVIANQEKRFVIQNIEEFKEKA